MSHMYSMSWKLYLRLQMNGWFRCSSIRRSLIMFRTLSDRITVASRVSVAREAWGERGGDRGEGGSGDDVPSSLRIYFRAKVKPVSFRSTMRTFPNAPFPTTRSRRK